MRKNINIIYEKIKKYIKENYVSLIILFVFAFFCFYDTGYSIYRPGGIINASDRVSGDNLYKSNGSFNMAYVSMLEGRLAFYLLAKVIPSWELIKNEDMVVSNNETMNEVLERDSLYYKEAISNAMYVAFNYANVPFKVESVNHYLVYKSSLNDSELKVGDEIVSYDGIKYDDNNKLTTYIQSKKVGDKIKIKYLSNGKEKETESTIYLENDRLYLGISISNIYNLKSKYNVKVTSKSSESGPSGGLITTLAIYNAITDKDITNGKRIVGTGTISLDGKVGEIGEVTKKLAAAVKKHADIFICPKENYMEAIEYAKMKNYDIIIKDVSNFEEAIDFLNSLEEK